MYREKTFHQKTCLQRIHLLYFTWKDRMNSSLVQPLKIMQVSPVSPPPQPLDGTYGFLTSSVPHVRGASSIHGLLGWESRSHHPTPKPSFWAPRAVQCMSPSNSSNGSEFRHPLKFPWIVFHSSLRHLGSACWEPGPVLYPRVIQVNKSWSRPSRCSKPIWGERSAH